MTKVETFFFVSTPAKTSHASSVISPSRFTRAHPRSRDARRRRRSFPPIDPSRVGRALAPFLAAAPRRRRVRRAVVAARISFAPFGAMMSSTGAVARFKETSRDGAVDDVDGSVIRVVNWLGAPPTTARDAAPRARPHTTTPTRARDGRGDGRGDGCDRSTRRARARANARTNARTND